MEATGNHFLGLVLLAEVLRAGVLVRNATLTPIDADAAPAFRIYGPAGVLAGGTGTLTAFLDTAAVTGATNAAPIVITSVAHKLSTGTRVTVAGVGGNTAANGTFNVTVLDADTFELDGSTGNGAYTTGGIWHVSGLYKLEIDTDDPAYETGEIYQVLVEYAVSATVKAQLLGFQVA